MLIDGNRHGTRRLDIAPLDDLALFIGRSSDEQAGENAERQARRQDEPREDRPKGAAFQIALEGPFSIASAPRVTAQAVQPCKSIEACSLIVSLHWRPSQAEPLFPREESRVTAFATRSCLALALGLLCAGKNYTIAAADSAPKKVRTYPKSWRNSSPSDWRTLDPERTPLLRACDGPHHHRAGPAIRAKPCGKHSCAGARELF